MYVNRKEEGGQHRMPWFLSRLRVEMRAGRPAITCLPVPGTEVPVMRVRSRKNRGDFLCYLYLLQTPVGAVRGGKERPELEMIPVCWRLGIVGLCEAASQVLAAVIDFMSTTRLL
jgi:hypothetical protein